MSWYTISQQKKLFIVEFKQNRLPGTPTETKTPLVENEEKAVGYIKHLFPGAIIVSVKQTNKYRVKFSPDFSNGSKDTYEDVIADSPEEAKKTILKKFPKATFNGNPVNLGVSAPTSEYLSDGRHKDESRGDFLRSRHNEGKQIDPWDRKVTVRNRT